MSTNGALDMDKVNAFARKVVGDITAVQLGTLGVIADRLGLYTALAEGGPATSGAFAARANIEERYAREWLGAMACHGYIAYDDGSKQFRLPPSRRSSWPTPTARSTWRASGRWPRRCGRTWTG